MQMRRRVVGIGWQGRGVLVGRVERSCEARVSESLAQREMRRVGSKIASRERKRRVGKASARHRTMGGGPRERGEEGGKEGEKTHSTS